MNYNTYKFYQFRLYIKINDKYQNLKILKNDQIFSVKDCISSCNKYNAQIRIRYITYTS